MKSRLSRDQTGSAGFVRETLAQQVCRRLKWQILEGKLTAGTRIWAGNLATELGVSIAPVKEALLMLSGEGLINNIPRRGSVVRAFSVTEMHELYQVRRLLEVEALEIMFAKGKVDDDFVDNLRMINRKIGLLNHNGEFKDRKAAFELDWEFHQQFMQNCEQSLLIELYSRLNTQAQIIRYVSWNIGPRGSKTHDEHEALVDALAARDIDAAKRSIILHLGSILNDFDHSIAAGEGALLSASSDNNAIPGGRRKTA